MFKLKTLLYFSKSMQFFDNLRFQIGPLKKKIWGTIENYDFWQQKYKILMYQFSKLST